MAQAQAEVQFSVDRVCPGYVTIETSMFVGFTNESDAEATVELSALDGGAPVWSAELSPGERVERRFEQAGNFRYSVSLLADFGGIIEVRAAAK